MPELPSGTVTFIIDIEGGTMLWERGRGARRAAAECHLALLRTAIEASGVLFAVVRDTVPMVVATAPEATAMALEAQQVLDRES
jgi:hypothetical protein